MADQGEWKMVSRRRRFPENCREKTAPSTKTVARPFVPYSKSFAQAVSMPGPNPNQPNLSLQQKPSPTISSTISPFTSSPSSPTHRPPGKTYISPHRPIALRFPPSPFFVEWRGRCFRCCRTGHAAASCRFQAKCGKCWSDGHIGSRCKKESKQLLNPAAKPFTPAIGHEVAILEPQIDSMLTGTYPYVPPVMPEPHSLMHTCFVERDAEYYSELQRLKSAIFVNTVEDLEVEKIADLIADSGLVKSVDLSFARLSRGRYLVHLPNGLAPDPVIRAIPAANWDLGLSFQQWSPLEVAAINIPNYTLVINILDVEPHLYREREMMRATSGIGVYLGTVAQADPMNTAVWTAVIATDNLDRVPPAVTMLVGGLQFTMPIEVLKVSPGPIYSPQEIPAMPSKYSKPVVEQPVAMVSSSIDDDDHLFTCPLKVLRNLCEGRDNDSIPSEIQDMLAGVKPPRLSKEDLIAFLLHQEPGKSVTENPPTNSAEGSESNRFLGTSDPLDYGVQQYSKENNGNHMAAQLIKPQGIQSVGETSGLHLEGAKHAPNKYKKGNSRRESARSRALKEEKANKGKARSLLRTKPNGHLRKEVRQIPFKKQVNRVENKTRYGLLHHKPHGKDVLHQVKSKTNQEVPFSRDFLLKGRGTLPNRTTSRELCHANFLNSASDGKSVHLINGLSSNEVNMGSDQGPSQGINLQLNPGGFYSLHVAYDRCTTLADGCGLNKSDVDETVIEENQYLRQVIVESEQNGQQDQGERVCTDPLSTDDEETETD